MSVDFLYRHNDEIALPWSGDVNRPRGEMALFVFLSVLAAASPVFGQPGTPQPPQQLFIETFQNLPPAQSILLTSYVGTGGETYTGAPIWVSAPQCNGIVTSFNSPNHPGCAFPGQIRSLAQLLGQFNGSPDPNANYSVSAYTAAPNPGPGLVQVETVNPLPIQVPNRFITFSVNVAVLNCHAAHPLLQFYLMNGAIEIPATSGTIDPCLANSGSFTGNYASNSAVLFSGPSLGVRMRNQQGSAGGNDFAIDDIRILDATPRLDKTFSPAQAFVDATSTLTFTITNTSELAAKAGWSFTDTLPAGLRVASPSGATTTCSSGSVTAAPGGTTISVSGNLNAGQAFCTASVNVTSSSASVYNNGPSNITASTGLNPPGNTQVTFIDLPADVQISKSGPPITTSGTNVTYTITVMNNGPGVANGVTVADPAPTGLTFVSTTCAGGVLPCAVGTLAVGSSASFDVTFAVPAGYTSPPNPDPITNVATVSTTSVDSNPANNTATAQTAVGAGVTDLGVDKNNATTNVVPGTTTTYTIRVTNAGPTDAINALVTDTFDPTKFDVPAVTWTCMATGAASCSTGSGSGPISVMVSIAADLTGAVNFVTFTVQAPVLASATGVLVNTVNVAVGPGQSDPNSTNDTDTDTLTPLADVTVDKTGPATAVSGTDVTYTITVTNLGPSNAENVTLNDPTPPGLTFVNASGLCAGGFPCSLGVLAPNVPVTITATYQIPASYTTPNPILNTAGVTTSTPESNTGNNTSTTVTLVDIIADVAVLKSVTPSTGVLVGSQVTFTVRVNNNGPNTATNVIVTDVLPAGIIYDSHAASQGSYTPGSGQWAIGTLLVGAPPATLDITATVTQPSALTNTATKTAQQEADPNSANDSSTATINGAPSADVGVSKAVDNPAPSVGTNVTFTVIALNNGPTSVTNLVVTDVLPAGLTFVSATPSQGTYLSGTGVWTVGGLAVSGAATMTITATVTTTGPIVNTVTRTSQTEADVNPANDTDSVSLNAIPSADLQVTKGASNPRPGVGTEVTFTVTIRNNGPSPATNLVVNDTLPAGLTYVSDVPSQGVYNSATGVWTVGALDVTQNATLSLTAHVDGPSPATLTNTATGSGAEGDPNPTNNSGSATITSPTVADLAITKIADHTVAAVGETVTFTIVVTNNGPGNATGVQVRESLPAGLVYVSSSATQGMYVPETGLWTVGALTAPDGGASRATLTVAADVTVGGVLRNTASIAAQDQPDPTPGNDVTFVEVESGPVDLGAQIWFVGDPTRVGAPFDFFLTVTNSGTNTLTGPVSVMVPFPAEIMFKMQATNWNCETVGRLIRCNRDDLVLAPGQSFEVGWWGIVLEPVPAGLAAYGVVTHATDVNPANDVSMVLLQAPVTLTADVEVAQTLTLTGGQAVADITVINHGPDAAAAVSLHDALPTGVTIVNVEPDFGTCQGTTTLLCELGPLAVGAGGHVRFTLAVPAGQTLLHEVSVASRPVDPVTANNAAVAIASPALPLDPARDTDGDGMPDVWESLMGLNPAVNDAAADPDGDGLTNAQEAAAGTHPRGFYHQYFAEGVVSPDFFRSTFDVLNADTSRESAVVVNGMLDSGEMMGMPARLAALGRRSVTAEELVHRPSAAFGAMIEADRPFASDRYTTWDPRMYGSALESGLPSTATQWFFAEGATGVFSLFYLLENPDMTQPVDVTVRYLRAFGEPIVRSYTMAPHSRVTLFGNEVPGLEATEVAADITASRPIVAERAMYLNTPTTLFEAGHVGGGATTTSATWFFAEGATGPFFDLYLLLANPNPVATVVDVQYQLPDGRVVTKSYPVDAAQRRTIYVDEEDAQLAATAVAMSLSATQPIVAERAMWWAPSPGGWYEGHVVLGTTTTGTRWALADGMIGGQWQESFYALIANQAAADGQARVTLVFDDGSQVSRVLALPPTSRTTVQIATEFPEAAGRHFSVVVESVGASPVPLVVEGSRYSSTQSQFWSAGGAMLGTKLQ